MLTKLKNNKKLQEGFTIIEVMIVLAIAGLILVVVLIAIPQLQRNQRNENRRSVTARIITEINSYAGNNNGNIPGENGSTDDDLDDIEERYLGCDAGDPPTNCDININDPALGTSMDLQEGSDAADAVPDLDDARDGDDLSVIYYQTDMVCDGETITDDNASGRNFALYTVLEGGAIYCLDNR